MNENLKADIYELGEAMLRVIPGGMACLVITTNPEGVDVTVSGRSDMIDREDFLLILEAYIRESRKEMAGA